MLTKEEIREKHLLANGLSVNNSPVGKRIQKSAFDAMDEYAKQECIAFAKWADENGYTQVAKYRWESLSDLSGKTDEQLYELYLKEKRQ